MSEPARDGLFQSCDIIIRRRSYLEFSICTPHALAIRNDCHYCDRFRATRVRHVERLDTYSSAGRDSAFAFDERDVADVFKGRAVPPQFFRRFEILVLCSLLHFVCKPPLESFEVARE